MNLITENYLQQAARWPKEGRHILAQFDATSIIVYQAYNRRIGAYAVEHQKFGGEFSFNRMSWIKPNFLWMMYRSGWGTKAGQEMVLAIRIERGFFEEILAEAVPSAFDERVFSTVDEWQDAVARSDVRLQWDPDRGPSGAGLPRRAIQLGMRGEMLLDYAQRRILEVKDLSDFVAAQRANVSGTRADLLTPREDVFVPRDAAVASRLGLNSLSAQLQRADLPERGST